MSDHRLEQIWLSKRDTAPFFEDRIVGSVGIHLVRKPRKPVDGLHYESWSMGFYRR